MSEGLELWSANWGLTNFQRRSCISLGFENGTKDVHFSGPLVGKVHRVAGRTFTGRGSGRNRPFYFRPHLE